MIITEAKAKTKQCPFQPGTKCLAKECMAWDQAYILNEQRTPAHPINLRYVPSIKEYIAEGECKRLT